MPTTIIGFLLMFLTECDRWHFLEEPRLQHDISRFGHVAQMYDDDMYVFGGFNGLMLNDM